MGGDFNEILFNSEKCGGLTRDASQLSEFSDILENCGLRDLNYTWDPFTWCNRRKGE